MLPLRAAATGTGPALRNAEDLLARGQAAAAEEIYRDLGARYPGLVEAHDGLGRALAAQGRTGEATAVYFRLGEGLLDAGDYRAAAGFLERAADLAPESAAVHGLLGRALLLDQAFARGGRHLERAVELGDRSLRTRLLRASAWWENGRADEAEEELRALAARTGAFAPRHLLGRLLLFRGRYEEAVEALSGLAEDASAGIDVVLDLAQALEGAGRSEESIAAYRRVVEQEPGQPQARYRLALLLHRSGRREEGAREMERFDRLYRDEQERTRREGLARARLQGAWELLRGGRADEALERFSALPETPESLRGAALAFSALGRQAEAVRLLERAVALAPEQGDLRLLLAEARLARETEP